MEALERDIIELKEELISVKDKLQNGKKESEQLNELFCALSKAQEEMLIAKTDNLNPFYKSKYADFASIVKASRTVLSKNNLSIIQRILTDEKGRMYLYTRLCHSSGQWIESKMPVNPPKADIQSIGSYITYLKRYNYAAMVGVVASGEDDDGEAAMKKYRNKEIKKEEEKLDRKDLKVLSNELRDKPEILNNVLKGYGLKKLSDLPKEKFFSFIKRIKEIKNAEK